MSVAGVLGGILPAGTFEAEPIQAGKKRQPRAAKWCKLCGRKHSKDAPCDLVEYQQGDTYEKVVFDEEAGAPRLKTFRHPGQLQPRKVQDDG